MHREQSRDGLLCQLAVIPLAGQQPSTPACCKGYVRLALRKIHAHIPSFHTTPGIHSACLSMGKLCSICKEGMKRKEICDRCMYVWHCGTNSCNAKQESLCIAVAEVFVSTE